MEMILRIQEAAGPWNISWKFLFRVTAVMLGAAALGFSAGNCEMRYKEKMNVNQRVSVKFSAEEMTEIMPVLPGIRLDLLKFEKITELPGTVKIEMGQSSMNIAAAPEVPASISRTSAEEASVNTFLPEHVLPSESILPPEDILSPEETLPPEEEVPVITTISVSVYGNGGTPEIMNVSVESELFTADMLEVPRRLGKIFNGWYVDENCTVPFDGNITGIESLSLYAGWKEFPGFVCDESGYIINCMGSMEAVLDGVLLIPVSEDCVGIAAGAFDEVAGEVFEIYIPSNITYIAPGAFDNMYNLMHIEVGRDNPAYYSEGGAVYAKDGTEVAYPPGLPRI